MERCEITDKDRAATRYRELQEKKFIQNHQKPDPKEGYKPLVFSILLFFVVLWLIMKFSS